MKTTDSFKKEIENHLKELAVKDLLFAETLKKPNKSIDECIDYILNEVKKSGSVAFVKSEIFAMAVHYYDEDDLKVKKFTHQVRIVSDQVVEITEEDKVKAKQDALNKLVEEEKQKLLKKKTPKREVAMEQTDLFS